MLVDQEGDILIVELPIHKQTSSPVPVGEDVSRLNWSRPCSRRLKQKLQRKRSRMWRRSYVNESSLLEAVSMLRRLLKLCAAA
eukprot:1191974-Amphidinium_carterae.1